MFALSGTWLGLPASGGPAPRALEARLLSPPPAPAAQPAKPPPKVPRATPRRIAPPQPVAAAPPMFAPQPEPEPAATIPSAPEAEPSAEIPMAPPVVAEKPAPEPASPPLRTLPSKGSITYTLYLGADRFSVGKAVQSWEVVDNVYKLGSMAETTGLVDLFRSQRLNYLSEGKVTAQGLRPQTFLMSRTRRGRTEAARAEFDWGAAKIMLGRVPERRTLALPPNSQDFISFMYQFSLAPPVPGRTRVAITNGSRLETYELEVLELENIETPLGMLSALPIKQVRRAGEESIEVWLAADYRYLPVKVRFIDREGNPAGEQIASEIRISEN